MATGNVNEHCVIIHSMATTWVQIASIRLTRRPLALLFHSDFESSLEMGRVCNYIQKSGPSVLPLRVITPREAKQYQLITRAGPAEHRT